MCYLVGMNITPSIKYRKSREFEINAASEWVNMEITNVFEISSCILTTNWHTVLLRGWEKKVCKIRGCSIYTDQYASGYDSELENYPLDGLPAVCIVAEL